MLETFADFYLFICLFISWCYCEKGVKLQNLKLPVYHIAGGINSSLQHCIYSADYVCMEGLMRA